LDRNFKSWGNIRHPSQGTQDLQLRWQVFQKSAELCVIKLASAQNGEDRPTCYSMHLLEHVSPAGRTSLVYPAKKEALALVLNPQLQFIPNK
jgi:hypothetical protein